MSRKSSLGMKRIVTGMRVLKTSNSTTLGNLNLFSIVGGQINPVNYVIYKVNILQEIAVANSFAGPIPFL